MYVLGRVWRRRASEFGPRAKTWASCNVLEIRATRLAQHLLSPLQAGALTPPLNPPLRGLQDALSQGTRNFFLNSSKSRINSDIGQQDRNLYQEINSAVSQPLCGLARKCPCETAVVPLRSRNFGLGSISRPHDGLYRPGIGALYHIP